MYEGFTDHARRVMEYANLEAQRLHLDYVSTELFLLGLAREEEGLAAQLLTSLGVDYSKIESAVQKLVQEGPNLHENGALLMTPRLKRMLNAAREEVQSLAHDCLGTGHPRVVSAACSRL